MAYFPEEEIETAEHDIISGSDMCMNVDEPEDTSKNRAIFPTHETIVQGACICTLLRWPYELPNATLHSCVPMLHVFAKALRKQSADST